MMDRPIRQELSPVTLKMIGVPRHLVSKEIEDFETFGNKVLEDVKEAIIEYLSDIPGNFENCHGVYLYGENGTGKTFIASVIIKEAYRHRYSARRVTFASYLSCYTRVWSARGLDEREEQEVELYKYKAAEFLALEEVGKEIDSTIAIPVLEDLLRYREDNGLPVILCTNLNVGVLREKYGESVYSLLKGNTVPIRIEGEDMRMKYFKRRAIDA